MIIIKVVSDGIKRLCIDKEMQTIFAHNYA